MLYQLPNGRVIEMSLEQYLAMDDTELLELNGLSNDYSVDAINPFYKSALESSKNDKIDKNLEEYLTEHEPDLLEINKLDKLNDDYFHSDDI